MKNNSWLPVIPWYLLLALLYLLFVTVLTADAKIIDFKEQYQDYLGDWYKVGADNLLSHPYYTVTDNGNNYTISRMGAEVFLPKRSWIDYNFYPDRIVPVLTIQNYSQINQLVTKVNSSAWYLTFPWKASQVRSVTDDLIDMGVFHRSIRLNSIDSNGSSYYTLPKVFSGDIRIYFNPQTFSGVIYPLTITENTITVTNATTEGWSTSNVSLNGSRWTDDGALALNLRNDSLLNMTGLVAYWSFDEVNGTVARQVNTESGLVNTTNQGTLYNMNTGLNNCTGNCSGWNSSGKIGNGLSFDGVNDYVDAGNNASLNITNGITVMVWLKTTSPFSNYDRIVAKANHSNTTGTIGYALYGSSGKGRFGLGSTGSDGIGVSTTVNITDGTWHNVVGTWNDTIISIYMDGNFHASDTYTGSPTNNANLRIGDASDGALSYFNGSIDEVRIYNRALNSSEVAVLYNTSMRNISMPVIMNQTAGVGNVINRTRIVYTGQDAINNASIYARQNGTTTWSLIQENVTSDTWYPIVAQFNSMDFGVQLNGNGSNTPFFTSLEWDEKTTISCLGWCYLGMNYTNKTLFELSSIYPNNTIRGWYNATSQKYESHRNGYRIYQEVNVPQKSGYYVYFNSITVINMNITGIPSITLRPGWNLVGNMNSNPRNLSELKSSIGEYATQAQYYNRTAKAWITSDSTPVPSGESFFVYVTSQTGWGE